MLKEFRDFAMRGNVLDLAIAVIIGAAFGAVVTSLVNDVVMPPIGLALGHVDFSNLFVNLSSKSYGSLAEAKAAGAPTVNYGLFINTVINFVIIAFVVFLLVQSVNRLKAQPEAAASPTQKDCPYCLSSIPVKATRCAHCTSELARAA